MHIAFHTTSLLDFGSKTGGSLVLRHLAELMGTLCCLVRVQDEMGFVFWVQLRTRVSHARQCLDLRQFRSAQVPLTPGHSYDLK